MKGRSIQDNLHLVREIIERIKDDDVAALINLDQSEAFDRVDHQFLVTVLETSGFEPEFCKVNFDKSEGLWLGGWKKGGLLPGPSRWNNGPVRILGVWFGPDLQLERNCSEIRAKVEAQVGAWFRRRLYLKGKTEVCAVYVFPLILYRLSVLPLPRDHRVALEQSLSKLLWKGQSPLISRKVCCQRPREAGQGMTDLESHWLTVRLAYLGPSLMKETVWGHKVRGVFPRLRSNHKAEIRLRPRDETRFSIECRRALRNLPRSSDLSWPRKKLYHGLVEGSVSDPLEKRLGWLLGDIRSQGNWAPGSSFLNNTEFSLTWHLARNVLALRDWAYRARLTDLSDCPPL